MPGSHQGGMQVTAKGSCALLAIYDVRSIAVNYNSLSLTFSFNQYAVKLRVCVHTICIKVVIRPNQFSSDAHFNIRLCNSFSILLLVLMNCR